MNRNGVRWHRGLSIADMVPTAVGALTSRTPVRPPVILRRMVCDEHGVLAIRFSHIDPGVSEVSDLRAVRRIIRLITGNQRRDARAICLHHVDAARGALRK